MLAWMGRTTINTETGSHMTDTKMSDIVQAVRDSGLLMHDDSANQILKL